MWKKHFKAVKIERENNKESRTDSNVNNYLSEVYAGHPNRLQRYTQYDDMARDSDISVGLNIIADFCTQSEEHTKSPFDIDFKRTPTESETNIINLCLDRWISLNNFSSRLWHMVRDTIKNGDTFFLRDPETKEWLWIDHFSVLMVQVDEQKGKVPEYYIVKGLDYNKKAQFATHKKNTSNLGLNFSPSNFSRAQVSTSSANSFHLAGSGITQGNHRPGQSHNTDEVTPIDAEHIIHLSLSTGMDENWPFGSSILDPLYKTYRQKELLEDAILIYRIQRAPERRVFYIDTGSMHAEKAQAYLNRIKNDVQQRRQPNRTSDGSSIIDTTYSPIAMTEDFWFSQNGEGRGSRVESLPGGGALDQLSDLDYFSDKLARGLHIPSSYMTNTKESPSYNDGKMGTAMIQELMFTKHCIRLQSLLSPVFDKEFKKYLEESGANIEDSLFEIRFNAPENFSKYRQMEIDQQRLNLFSSVQSVPFLSARFKLKRYLGLSDEEIVENEELWKAENPRKVTAKSGESAAETSGGEGDLGSLGMSGGDMGLDFPGEGGDDLGDLGTDDAGGLEGGGASGGADLGGAAPPPSGPGQQSA